MIDDRSQCTCGHLPSEHDHYVAECYRCDCPMYADQNDLDAELNADLPRGWLRGSPATRRGE